jgi:hypothetical protein
MPSAANWERNSSLDSWHVGEIEYPGRTPDGSDFVHCGNDTITQDDIDNGG